MAKRGKMQPAEMTLTFPIGALSADPGYTLATVDLSQCASIVNRRFYRQGLNWAVAGFTLHTANSAAQGTVDISRLPSTWVVSAAWEKTMRMWLKQQNEAIEDAGLESAIARFRDFKIHMDTTHAKSEFVNNYIPYVRTNDGASWQPYLTGEWEESRIVLPNSGGSQFSLHMIGANNGVPNQSKGMIKAYEESRAVPHSPDPDVPPGAGTGLFVEMFDDGDNNTAVTNNATGTNDELPYSQFEYPGNENNADGLVFHDTLALTTTSVSGKTKCAGSMFPAGLIRFRIDNELRALTELGQRLPVAWIQIHLVPGSHRGYMAQTMLEM